MERYIRSLADLNVNVSICIHTYNFLLCFKVKVLL